MSESAKGRCGANLQGDFGADATLTAMKILNLLHVVVAEAFYRWAMREISPMHPDVPKIMLRQQQLREKHRQIWA
jgi:hypothetical protein